MKNETFEYIWDHIIKYQIDSIYAQFDESVRNSYSLQIRPLDRLKRDVFDDYKSIRGELKKYYYNNSDTKESNNKIDRHKIAACMAYSLIRNKAFSFTVNTDMPNELFVVNYKLAYTVSLGIVYALLIAQYALDGNTEYANKLSKAGTLRVPATSKGHNEYNQGRIYTLALNDLYGNTFDVLTYSDMMFWIEHYNRQLIENSFL